MVVEVEENRTILCSPDNIQLWAGPKISDVLVPEAGTAGLLSGPRHDQVMPFVNWTLGVLVRAVAFRTAFYTRALGHDNMIG